MQRYVVLLVLTDGPLTDGQFSDRQKTIDAVVEASQLPLSIMFVGVGDDPVSASHHPIISCNFNSILTYLCGTVLEARW